MSHSSCCQVASWCQHAIACAHRFFEDYKKNEHKEVIVDDFLGSEEAKKVVKDSLVGAVRITFGCTAARTVRKQPTRQAQTRSCTVKDGTAGLACVCARIAVNHVTLPCPYRGFDLTQISFT